MAEDRRQRIWNSEWGLRPGGIAEIFDFGFRITDLELWKQEYLDIPGFRNAARRVSSAYKM